MRERVVTGPLWQGVPVFRRHFLTYLALSTMAIGQPVLDLYGKNPTVFSAAKLAPAEVVAFVLIIVFVPTLVALGVDLWSRGFGPKVNESVRLVLISGFSFLLGFAVARWAHVERSAAFLATGAVCAVVVPWLFDRRKVVREWSRYLAVLAVAVLVTTSVQLKPVVLASDGPRSAGVLGDKKTSVLQIVFDEFPLAPLLGPDGWINKDRFPHFAELAAQSTWYRNNVAASNFTHQAVPAVLSSSAPKSEGGPFLAQYPRNIFTAFADKTTVDAIQPVTSLCPVSVCASATGDSGPFDARRFVRFVRDAGYVYGHRVLPPFLRRHIPSIEGTWGGFGAVADKFREQFSAGVLSQVNALSNGIRLLTDDPSPRVQVVHVLLPHAPWRITPDLRVAPLSTEISTSNPSDADGVRDTYQTFLYQLAAADTALGDAIAQLKAADRWDDTLLVVTADHGISFDAGVPQRHTDFTNEGQYNDVYRIPTFIKYPAQTAGAVSDCATTNLDLLPTILDVMKLDTGWTWAGESVARSCPQGRTREVVSATGQRTVIATGFEKARERAAHYATIVDNRGAARTVARVGASASLVGTPIKSSTKDASVSAWTLKQESMFYKVSDTRGRMVPSLVTGTVRLSSPLPDGTEGVVAVDGVAAGVLGELSGASRDVDFTAVLDFTLLTDGAHSVELFVRRPDGTITRVGVPD